MEMAVIMLRLDKYLADMGVGTRQEVKQKIRKGLVTIDGEVVKAPERKVDPDTQEVSVSGELISYVTYEYFMLNKPAGVVSATEDKREKTVIDCIDSKKRKDLFPVGRLDNDTEGLLLITNDGALAHTLLSPKKHVDKVYYAKIAGCVTEETKQNFKNGVNIGTVETPEMTMPAALEIIESGEMSEIRLTIQEGKFHHVKRMFESQGMKVTYLKRESMGTLQLDETLKIGEYRPLTEAELESL
jgi:16S rRNA pseudouridine516 synthase